jgi:hypothetical protein
MHLIKAFTQLHIRKIPNGYILVIPRSEIAETKPPYVCPG